MTDETTKTTQALLRALMKEMEKTLTKQEPAPPPEPGTRKTRVNAKEFNKTQESESWWDDGGDEDEFMGLRPRPKPRGKRRLR
ncbi:hypothetical protein [Stenotrophomonas maltophilia]|uniref:hypothetical protein n=1 Tax=Stenotrophomonas maltophilia TaxID=40324 RepID=UPI000A89BF22|nr:hypothetical protein [Stenotrophomonas maltophilia]ELK2668560.1 hypothetical protein [Stenotrophomonas maltophilia]MBH1376291.1 hypothetical protein [Stenotrophomonas maltophilia]MBH1558585.1 hypothetical protein [Stenotrophomonas maltophilia]